MEPPDITRVFKGARNEFEVEIVFADREGGKSPKEGHAPDYGQKSTAETGNYPPGAK